MDHYKKEPKKKKKGTHKRLHTKYAEKVVSPIFYGG
jgi:hypothetical protein